MGSDRFWFWFFSVTVCLVFLGLAWWVVPGLWEMAQGVMEEIVRPQDGARFVDA